MNTSSQPWPANIQPATYWSANTEPISLLTFRRSPFQGELWPTNIVARSYPAPSPHGLSNIPSSQMAICVASLIAKSLSRPASQGHHLPWIFAFANSWHLKSVVWCDLLRLVKLETHLSIPYFHFRGRGHIQPWTYATYSICWLLVWV